MTEGFLSAIQLRAALLRGLYGKAYQLVRDGGVVTVRDSVGLGVVLAVLTATIVVFGDPFGASYEPGDPRRYSFAE